MSPIPMNSPQKSPAGPLPARPQIAAALAEQMAAITAAQNRVAQMLAELVLTPVVAEIQSTGPAGPEPMWKIQQIADAANVGYYTANGWIKDGDLAAVAVGREYRVPDSEWKRFVRDQIRAGVALRAA